MAIPESMLDERKCVYQRCKLSLYSKILKLRQYSPINITEHFLPNIFYIGEFEINSS